MAVKVNKLFKDATFNKLSDKAKLLYIYLVTHPDINIVGVLSPNIEVVKIETGITDDETFRSCWRELLGIRKVWLIQAEDILYFVIPDHFTTIPKSEASVIKVNKTLEALPEPITTFLESKGISSSAKIRTFVKPSPEEVTNYAISKGHLINGEEFVQYYDSQTERYGKKNMWVNSYGKQIKDWKATMRKVWFKDSNKLKHFDDAPKGFEMFYVTIDGKVVSPEGWRNGQPYSKNLTTDVVLKQEFKKQIQ